MPDNFFGISYQNFNLLMGSKLSLRALHVEEQCILSEFNTNKTYIGLIHEYEILTLIC